jgi:hypothetical protein
MQHPRPRGDPLTPAEGGWASCFFRLMWSWLRSTAGTRPQASPACAGAGSLRVHPSCQFSVPRSRFVYVCRPQGL